MQSLKSFYAITPWQHLLSIHVDLTLVETEFTIFLTVPAVASTSKIRYTQVENSFCDFSILDFLLLLHKYCFEYEYFLYSLICSVNTFLGQGQPDRFQFHKKFYEYL